MFLHVSRRRPFWRAFLAGSALMAAMIPAEAAEWESYHNDRYGFSVDVPTELVASAPPDNGHGQAFTSKNGRSKLAVYGHLFVDVAGLAEDERDQERMSKDEGVHITYRHLSDRATSFSGLKGDTIVYRYAINTCKGTASAMIDASYPASEKARFDPIVTHMVRTLQGSNDCWSPG